MIELTEKVKEFRNRRDLVTRLAEKHQWMLMSLNTRTKRISFKDWSGTLRAEILLASMSVYLYYKGRKKALFKKVDEKKIDEVFQNPYTFITEVKRKQRHFLAS